MNTKQLRYGMVGALFAFPFGLAAGAYMVEIEWWLALMGTEWAAYKSAVSSLLMIGFGLGIAMCPSNIEEEKAERDES